MMMMMCSLLSRALIMVFGYVYPAYECFKAVEKNKAEIKQLVFWCQYWILVAILTVCERIGDNLISWLSMYSEAKLIVFIYLWYSKTRGCSYAYDCFFRPLVANHEKEIDQKLLELKVKTGEIAHVYWEKAATYGQIMVFEILQYVSARSSSLPHSNQVQEQPAGSRTEKLIDANEVRRTNKEKDKEESSKSHQLHENPSELETRSIQSVSSLRNESGNSHLSQQDTVIHESIKLSPNHWRLFGIKSL